MKNEKGLTLIELLATIVIFSIVSSLLFGLFMNIQKNYQLQRNQNQLVQDANQIITFIKSVHQKRTPYSIHFDAASKTTYLEDSLTKHTLGTTPENVTIEFGMNQAFEREDEIIDYNPLFLKLSLKNENGKTYVVDTIISNY